MEIFYEITLLSILNLHTVEWSTQFASVMASNIVALLTIIFACGVLTIYIVGYFRLSKKFRTEQFGYHY